MNKLQTILPDSISIYPHLLAFDLAMKRRLESLPLEVLLVYMVDRVPAESLPLLAKQFDVLGYKGLRLAKTDQDKRNLIKKAIELHRYKGTVYAIEEALKSIGFADVKVNEHANGHWAKFSIEITNTSVVVTDESFADLIAMVKEYKNARSELVSVNMVIEVEDIITVETDQVVVAAELRAEDSVIINGGLFYDGSEDYDGSFDHSSDSDSVTFN